MPLATVVPAWTSPPRGDPRDCQPTQTRAGFSLFSKGFVSWPQEWGDACAVLAGTGREKSLRQVGGRGKWRARRVKSAQTARGQAGAATAENPPLPL